MLTGLLFITAIQGGQAPVAYHLAFPNAVHHEAAITVAFTALPPGTLELRMSRSSPGRYALHEFAKNIYDVRAVDGRGRTLAITRPNPYQWDVAGHGGAVTVSYTLFGDRADGTYTGIDRTHAHLNMPATLMWARGLRDRPITLRFEPPAGAQWRVATQLVPTADSMTFSAPNFDYLMDSPTELSAFSLRQWTVRSGERPATLRLAIHHAGTDAEVDRYAGMMQRIVLEEQAVFGELAPYDYGTYTFIADYLPYVAGDGMEHRNSTILASTRSLADNALGLVGTVAHEFFHSWNMERLRSKALEPFDFEHADMSQELWFGEGFTQYYGVLMLRRAGVLSEQDYADRLGSTLDAVINAPGRRYFSAVEMSMQAPFVDAATSVDPTNRANTFISYYTWGAAIAAGLDLTLRTKYAGKTLDGYMRLAWERLGRPEHYYTMADLQAVLADYTGDRTYAQTFFDRFIAGRAAVDYAPLLQAAGMDLVKAHPGEPTLGFVRLEYTTDGAAVTSPAIVGTPLYEAGIDRDDVIAELDGRPLRRMGDVEEILRRHRPGDTLTVAFVQRLVPRRARIVLAENPELEVHLFEDEGKQLTDAERAFREGWLGSGVR